MGSRGGHTQMSLTKTNKVKLVALYLVHMHIPQRHSSIYRSLVQYPLVVPCQRPFLKSLWHAVPGGAF